jgi:hypothetical protein
MNSTDTFWDVDGHSLQTYAFNIQTWGGDAQAPPALRGADTTVPYMPGRAWTQRVPDSRTITLGMWVVGANPDGTVPENGSSREIFERNFAQLRALLWTPRRQINLTKRFRRFGDPKVYTATAKAQFVSGLNPVMNGRTRANFTVDLLLSDPYFYGPEETLDIDPQKPVEEFTVLGDDRTMAINTEITGLTKRLRITNETEEELWFEYDRALTTGQKAVIRNAEFSATHDINGSPSPSSGSVTHSGDIFWMYLNPGRNKLAVSERDIPSRGTVWTNLSLNPSFERVSGSAPLRTNVVPNPSFERASTNASNVWRTNLNYAPDLGNTTGASFIAVDTTKGPDGKNLLTEERAATGGPVAGGILRLPITRVGDQQTPGITFFAVPERNKGISVLAGQSYAASIYSRAGTTSFVGAGHYVFVRFFGLNNQTQEFAGPPISATTSWQRASLVVEAPSWALEANFGVRTSPQVFGEFATWELASAMFENSSVLKPFFSGSSPLDSQNAQHQWKSTAGASQSIKVLSAPVFYRNQAINPSFEGTAGGAGLTELDINRAPNPSFEAPAAAQNLVLNPRGALSTDKWGSGIRVADTFAWGAPLLRSTNDGPVGVDSFVYLPPSASGTDPERWKAFGNLVDTVRAGQAYTISVFVRSETLAAQGRIRATWNNAVGTRVGTSISPVVAVPEGVWTKVSFTVAAPTGATWLGVEAEVTDYQQGNPGSVIGVSGWMVVPVANVNTPYSGNYFDGSSISSVASYRWVGAAHASSSIRTEAVVRTINRLTNPSFEDGTTGVVASSAVAISSVTVGVGARPKALQVRSTSTTTGINNFVDLDGGYAADTFRSGMEAGRSYTLMATIIRPVALSSTLPKSSLALTAALVYTLPNDATVYAAATPAAPATAGRSVVRARVKVPANATAAWVRLYNGYALADPLTNDVYFDDVALIEQDGNATAPNYAGPYFDGATEETAETRYLWNGTANKAESWQVRTGYVGFTNVFPNPSFEKATTAVPDQVNTVANVTASQDSTWAARGTNSLKITPVSTGNNTYVYLMANNAITAGALVPGVRYRAMATVRLAAAQNGSLNTYARRIVVVGDVSGTFASNQAPNAAGVYEVALDFTVGTEDTSFQIRLYNGAPVDGGDIWWDQVAIILQESRPYQSAGSAPQLTTHNYTGLYFDGNTITPDEYVQDWAGEQHNSRSYRRAPVPAQVATDGALAMQSGDWAASGTKSLRIIPTAPTGGTAPAGVYLGIPGAANNYAPLSMAPGSTYTAVIRVRLPAALTGTLHTNSLALALDYADSAFTHASVYSSSVPNAAGITTLRFSFTVPAGVRYAALRFVHGGARGSGDIYLDEFQLVQGANYTGTFFTGSSISDEDYKYAWRFLPNESVSVRSGVRLTGGYTTSNVTPVQSSSWHGTGVKSLRLSPSSELSNVSYFSPGGDLGALRWNLKPGSRYTVMATRRLAAPLTGTLHELAGMVSVYTRVGTEPYVNTRSTPLKNVAGEETVRLTFTVPVGATEAFFRLYHGGLANSGDIWWDDLLLTEVGFDSVLGYTGKYFDGDTAGETDFIYQWDNTTGDRFSSQSVQRGVAVSQVAGNSVASSNGVSTQSSTVSYTTERKRSLRITPTGATNFTFATLNGVAMEPNRSYVLRGRFYQERPQEAPLSVYARRITVAWSGFPGYLTPTYQKMTDNVAGWSEYVAVVNTPPTGSFTAAYVWHGGSETSAPVYWDDVMITDASDSDVQYFDGSINTGSADAGNSWAGTPNASFSVQTAANVAGATASSSAIAYQATDWSHSGTKSLRITPRSLTNNDTYAAISVDLAPGTYTIMATAHLTSSQGGTLHQRARTIFMSDNARQYISPAAPNVEGDHTIRWTVTTTGRVLLFRLYNGAAANLGDIWWDGLVIVKLDEDGREYTGDYFDGSTLDTEYADYEWTGVPHSSTSIIRGVASVENVKIRYRPAWL